MQEINEPPEDTGYVPPVKWEFDAEVCRVFDSMLARSIPQYEVMREACTALAVQYAQPNTFIIDLGCSRGEALRPIVDKLGAHQRYVGCEISEPMLEAARERFKGMIQCGVVDIRKLDLRKEYPPLNASVTLCVLTLQFTPIEYRQRILRDIWKHTLPGGALILVEKVLGATADLDACLVKNYWALKAEHKYSQEEIDRKRMALEGVLVPVTASWNEDLLRQAGFSQMDCFYRAWNFCGWIAVK